MRRRVLCILDDTNYTISTAYVGHASTIADGSMLDFGDTMKFLSWVSWR